MQRDLGGEIRRSINLRVDVPETIREEDEQQQQQQQQQTCSSSPGRRREPTGGCGAAPAHRQGSTPLADALSGRVCATSATHGNGSTQTHSARTPSPTLATSQARSQQLTQAQARTRVFASGQESESLFSSPSLPHSKPASSSSVLSLDLGSASGDLLLDPPISPAFSTISNTTTTSTTSSALFQGALEQLGFIQELAANALISGQPYDHSTGENYLYYYYYYYYYNKYKYATTTTASTTSPNNTRASFLSSVSSATDVEAEENDIQDDNATFFLHCDPSDSGVTAAAASPVLPSFPTTTTILASTESMAAAGPTKPGWTLKKPSSASGGRESAKADKTDKTAAHQQQQQQRSRSRSSSPLVFWSKKGTQRGQQPQQQGAYVAAKTSEDADPTWFPPVEDRDRGDELDSVSNHLGRIAESTSRSHSRAGSGSGSGTPNGWRDLIEPLDGDAEQDEASRRAEHPPQSITREHYLALPPAIQRKYFSPIERLQFAHDSSEVDRIYDHYDLTASQIQNHRRHRPAHSSPDFLSAFPRESQLTTGSDNPWLVNCPIKSNKLVLTRNEQVNLIRHLRHSVILDAASEAIRNLAPTPDIDHSTATLSSRRGSSDSMASFVGIDSDPTLNGRRDPMRESLYDSFRWLDEEEDLNLGLFLDDYHANLREDVPQTGKNRRPSFRRHLSISKLPFGRPSFSSSNADPSPVHSPTKSQHPSVDGPKRISRTLSLIHPGTKYSRADSLPIADPLAAHHYQDPEARQTLRTYASPSKFDEALQYGFPTADAALSRTLSLDKKLPALPTVSNEPDTMRSFMHFGSGAEDDLSDTDDASSIRDPDSPKTPEMGGLTVPPGHDRPTRATTDPPPSFEKGPRSISAFGFSKVDSHIASQRLAREMTLRMTLTRPDLRANEELIYGWQPQAAYLNAGRRRSTTSPPMKTVTTDIHQKFAPAPASTTSSGNANGGASTTTTCWSDSQHSKVSIEAMLAGLDNDSVENSGERDTGLKRLWNKVRRI